MELKGHHVILRDVEPDDFPHIAAWNADPYLGKYIEDSDPKTVADCVLWHKSIQSNRHNQTFAIATTDGRLIGDIELDHIAWRSGDAELRIRIGNREDRGRGMGTDAVMTILRHAFDTLRLARVYLRVFDSNRPAIRCYLKCGFRKRGRLRRQMPDGRKVHILLMDIEKTTYEKFRLDPTGKDLIA